MNYSYLSAYISRKTGKHFSEHLNDTRIRHAKELLSVTNFSISYISETIGYADQSYFGKVFKKQVGMTPCSFAINTRERTDIYAPYKNHFPKFNAADLCGHHPAIAVSLLHFIQDLHPPDQAGRCFLQSGNFKPDCHQP